MNDYPQTDVTFTKGEEIFCMYKLGLEGSGMTKLIEAIFALDIPNREKIALGFPELVDCINRFGFEKGYWKDLVDRWNSQGWQQLHY